MTTRLQTNSPLTASLADRLLALLSLCPDGQMLKARNRERLVECWRDGSISELTVRMMLTSDVTGHPILDAVARLDRTDESGRLSLYRRHGERTVESFTKKEERYLAALLSWAEPALRAAEPTARTRQAPPWQRDLIRLMTCLSGQSRPTAARRLQALFNTLTGVDDPKQRFEDFLNSLCADGWLIQLDWKEEEPEQLQGLLHRRFGNSPVLRAGTPANMIEQAAAWLADRSHHLLEIESGTDAHLLAVVGNDRAEEAGRLLAAIGVPSHLHPGGQV